MKLGQEQDIISDSSDSEQNVKRKNCPPLREIRMNDNTRPRVGTIHLLRLVYIMFYCSSHESCPTFCVSTLQFNFPLHRDLVLSFTLLISHWTLIITPLEEGQVRQKWLLMSDVADCLPRTGPLLNCPQSVVPRSSFSIFLANQNISFGLTKYKKDKRRYSQPCPS